MLVLRTPEGCEAIGGSGSTQGVHRSAKTGEFVKAGYANRNKSTTLKDS